MTTATMKLRNIMEIMKISEDFHKHSKKLLKHKEKEDTDKIWYLLKDNTIKWDPLREIDDLYRFGIEDKLGYLSEKNLRLSLDIPK